MILANSFFSSAKLTAHTSCILSLFLELIGDSPLVSPCLESIHHDPMLSELSMYQDEDVPTSFSSPEPLLCTEAFQEDYPELSGINFQELLSFSPQTC